MLRSHIQRPRTQAVQRARAGGATLAIAVVVAIVSPFTARAAVTPPHVPEPIAAVTMLCPEGGIDVNKASVEQLSVLPHISDPIAERIVAARPFLRIDPDLLRVAGIGRGKLAAIVADGRACATPTSTPPPYFDVCGAGDGRLDANRPQSEAALAGLFGRPTAARIVAGIPYWNLDHVRSEGEAGAGPGKMAKLMNRLCVTPPTIVYDGVRYGWIDPDRGGYVDWPAAEEGGASYRLTVPGGVVTAQPGAWGSVSPQPTPADLPAGAPAANMHIHGGWSGTVYVAGPPDDIGTELAGQWTDTVWHLPPGGQWEINWGGAVDRVDGRVTTALTSLSPITWIRQKADQFVGIAQEAALKIVEWAEHTIRRFLGVGAPPPACDPNAQPGRQPDGAFLATFGELLQNRPISPPLWHCIERKDTDTADWKYVLNRGVSLFVHADNPATDRARVTGVGLTGDLLVDLFASGGAQLLKNTTFPLLLPATSQVDVRLDSSAGSGNLFVGGAGSMAAATVIIQALKELSALFPPPLGDIYGVLNACIFGTGNQVETNIAALQSAQPAQIYDALMSTFNTSWDCVTDRATGLAQQTLLHNDLTDPLRRIDKFSRALLFIKALSYGFIIADGVSLGMVGDDANDVRMQFNAPLGSVPPGFNDGALPNGATSLPATVLLKERGPSIASYLRSGDRVAHHIPNGGTYVCLAPNVPTWFGVDAGEFDAATDSRGEDATCPPAPGERRDLSTWRNVLLRDLDGGVWWYVRPDGNLVALNDGQDGPTCRFDDLLVWDMVTDEELSSLPGDPDELERRMC